MKLVHELNGFYFFPILVSILILSFSGCSKSAVRNQSQPEGYAIAPDAVTTRQRTITFPSITGLLPTELSHVSQYSQYGYGRWAYGPGLPSDVRTDIMPSGYAGAAVTKKAKLLSFFTISDIHITDKESPSQLIYLQQLNSRDAAGHFDIFTGHAVHDSCSRRSRSDDKRPAQDRTRSISASLWATPATALSTTS